MYFGRLNWVGSRVFRGLQNEASQCEAHIPRPLSESFINTSSPSLTSPLTRFTQAMGDWRDTARITRAIRSAVSLNNESLHHPRRRRRRHRSSIAAGTEHFLAGLARAPPRRLSRRNDLVRGLNSRSHTLLDTTIQERPPNTLRCTRTDAINCTSFSSSR